MIFDCIECERRRVELAGQLPHLITKTKQRARDEKITYGIYIDKEDKKLVSVPINTCYARGQTPIEIISQYQ